MYSKSINNKLSGKRRGGLKIYLDVLLITNGIMTMVYIEALEKITHRKASALRFFAACCIGGIASLLIAVSGTTYFSAIVITLAKAVSIILILLTVFDYKNFWEFMRYLILYIVVCAVFLGITLVIWQISDSKIIYMHNYTIYFDISVFKLVVAVILAYILISLYEIICRKSFDKAIKYKAVYTLGNYEVKLPAVCDSGNRLCDTFSGVPVVVFYCSELYYHFDLDYSGYENMSGFRLIPYKTISGQSLIHVTTKGNVKIIDDENNEKQVKCCIGIVPSENSESKAIFNPSLLI